MKMFVSNKLLFISAVFLTTGCASYKAQTLANLNEQSAPYSEKKENITVSCKAFTEADCKRYLDRNVIKKGFQPIQISIDNDTKRSLIFSKNNIGVPCADAASVADKVHTSTVGRATAYGVGAIIIWPLAIPAIVDGVKSSNANSQLDRDFASKATEEQTILPHSKMNGLIFVPVESYRETFQLTLVDKETKEPVNFTLSAVR